MVGCTKSVDILQQTFYRQADIRMHSHGLRRLVDHKLLQVVNSHVTIRLSRPVMYRFATSYNKSSNCKLEQA